MLLVERRQEGRQRQAVVDRVWGQDREPRGGGEDGGSSDGRGAAILVQHGIHSGAFPIAGMTVGQARRILGPIVNIDPGSTAIVNGRPVENEEARVLTSRDELLQFVKRSSMRGGS